MATTEVVKIPKFDIEGYILTMDAGASKAEWEAAGRALGKLNKGSGFWVGDWFNAGVDAGFTRGDMYDEAEKITGLEQQTIKVYAWTAKQVSPANRNSNLSFAHHQEVAKLPEKQQKNMLDTADKKEMTKYELRDKVHDRTPAPVVTLSIDEQLAKELWKWVARARGRKLWAEVVKAADEVATANKRLVFDKE